MKITKQQLKRIIKEELKAVLEKKRKDEECSSEVDPYERALEAPLAEEEKFLQNVKSTGEWTDYTIEQLKTKIAAANKEQEAYEKEHGKANPAITKRLRQMNFSKNAKEGDYEKK
jgi:hypothetical protein